MVLSVCLSSFIFCVTISRCHTTFLLLTNVTLYINYLLCFVIFVINFKTGTLWSVMFQNLFSISDENKKIVLQCWVIVYPFIIVGLTYRPLSAEYMFVQLLVLLRLMGDCFCIYSQDDLNLQCYSQRLSSLCFCCNIFCITAKFICSFWLLLINEEDTRSNRGDCCMRWWNSLSKRLSICQYCFTSPHVFLCDHINQRVCFHIENLKSANQLCCEVKQCYSSSRNFIIMILRMSLIQLMGPCVLNNCIVIFRCW